MAQIARPSADVSTTGWSATPSGALWSTLDEASSDDADYIKHTYSATADVAEVSLASVTDPSDHTSHSVSYRCWIDFAGPFGNDHELRVSLIQGTTVIAQQTTILSNTPTTSPTNFTLNLTTGEAGNITDYSDLRIRFEVTNGDSGKGFYVSQAYLSVPDAPSSGGFTISEFSLGRVMARFRDKPTHSSGYMETEYRLDVLRENLAVFTGPFQYADPLSEEDARNGGICALTKMWAPAHKLVYTERGRVIGDFVQGTGKRTEMRRIY